MSPLQDALEAIRLRDEVRAERAARRAVEDGPGEPRARAALALALLLARRSREALAEADRAVAVAPGAPWALLVRSATLRELRRWREAIAAAEGAVGAAPRDARAHLGLALSLFGAGHGERVRGALERVRELAPDDPVALRLLGELELRRDPRAAEAIFRAALRTDAGSAEARAGLARALARQGRMKESEEAFEAASVRDPAIRSDRDARQRDLLAFVQATLAAFVTVLCLQLGQGAITSRWPAARGVVTSLSFVAMALAPVVLLGWVWWRLTRSRVGVRPDPQLASLAGMIEDAETSAAP
jgi:tetratricopeptide (TPR) repeat protein